MAMKLTAGRIAKRFRGSPMFPGLTLPMFPGLMLRPNQGGLLPFAGRWRARPQRLGGWQPPKIYGRIGSLEVRLARKKSEIRQAQRLRYKVFYEEMSAVPGALAMLSRRDEDAFDPIFDHLLVVDRSDATNGHRWRRARVVGTYRVLRQEVADLNDGFYTQGEYDILPLIRAKGSDTSFMELGRSCVLKPYRNKRTMELLWQGIWSYVREHGVDVMLGCASFEGTDPSPHATALSFLHHNALAPAEWRVRAHEHLRVDMNMLPANAVNVRAALKALPPLIKGYLRLGAYVGDGAVIDHQFGTTDVLIILPVEAIRSRYFAHFGSPGELSSPISQSSRLTRLPNKLI
jgi:L-ornithine Nalpha-acyltransferase